MEKIYVFGKGKIFRRYKEHIRSNYDIVGFIDNKIQEPQWIEDYKCFAYNPHNCPYEPAVEIMICTKSFIEVAQQLKLLGIESAVSIITAPKVKYKNCCLEYSISDNEMVMFSTYDEYQELVRMDLKKEYPEIEMLTNIKTSPFDDNFGSAFGKPVDRYYIEAFIEENKDTICGTVLEVGTDIYTKRYGEKKVERSVVSHVKGWDETYILNLETGEGVISNNVDCFICTQVLQYVFDLKTAFENIYCMLKPGGTALITVPGIKSICTPDDNNWGEYWSFTEKSLIRFCENVCDATEYEIKIYGNVKITIAYLYGMCSEFLDAEDFKYNDEKYPFLLTVKMSKKK